MSCPKCEGHKIEKLQDELATANRLNSEMRALLIRWNEAWKVAAIVDSGHTHTDAALINAQTELFLEATPEVKRKGVTDGA